MSRRSRRNRHKKPGLCAVHVDYRPATDEQIPAQAAGGLSMRDFLDGLLSIFTFGRIPEKCREIVERDECDAIRSDWENVGDDLRGAMGMKLKFRGGPGSGNGVAF